jgi:hypothetical protein
MFVRKVIPCRLSPVASLHVWYLEASSTTVADDDNTTQTIEGSKGATYNDDESG